MRQLIKYCDFTAPKFNMFINGHTCHRTFRGGLFHLVIVLIILAIAAVSFSSYIRRDNPRMVVSSGYFPLRNAEAYYQYPQILTIQADSNITWYHSFVVSGKFRDGTYSKQMTNCSENGNSKYCLDFSTLNLLETPYFFVSFPRCNYMSKNPGHCITLDDEYKRFLNDSVPQLISLSVSQVLIKPDDYQEKILVTQTPENIYLEKTRGASYIIHMESINVEEHKGWIFDRTNNTLVYSMESIIQETSDELSWNDVSYSIFFKVKEDYTVIYQFYYDDIFKCFSYIGGLSNFLSILLVIKTTISTHGADIFLMNSNFIESIMPLNSRNKNEEDDMAYSKKPFLAPDVSSLNLSYVINADPHARVLRYRRFLKYKCFKSCLKTRQNIYENFKWILDIQYLIKIYIQFHFMKNFLLSQSQVKFIENLSLFSKINVQSTFNMKNMYYEKKHNEARRQQSLLEAKRLFMDKQAPYDFNDEEYRLDYEESLNRKMANCDHYLTLN